MSYGNCMNNRCFQLNVISKSTENVKIKLLNISGQTHDTLYLLLKTLLYHKNTQGFLFNTTVEAIQFYDKS